MRTFYISFLLIIAMPLKSLFAQSISGPSSLSANEVAEYSFFDDQILSSPGWGGSGYNMTQSWQSGFAFYCTASWPAPGNYTIEFYNNGIMVASMPVSVAGCAAGKPVTGFTYTSSDTQVTITRTSSPAAGQGWYWQTGESGTYNGFPYATYSTAFSGTYYLKSQDVNSNCWGNEALATAAVPNWVSTNGAINCGPGSVTITASPEVGYTVQWYATNSGGSPIATGNSYNTPHLSTTTTYWACNYDANTGVVGKRTPVTANIVPLSVGGTVSGGGNFCSSASGTLTLSGHTGSVVRWEQNVANAGWTSIGNTTTSLNYSGVVTSTTYRAIVKSEICAEVASASTAIGIVPLSVGGTVSGGGNFCSSASGTLILSGQTGSVVRWEQNVNNAGWTNINSTDALLHYYSVTKTTQYRAWVVSGLCAGQYSSIATVSVSPASVGGIVSGGGNFCASASGTLTLSGHTGSVVRWEQNVANAGWTSIGNTTTSLNYSGVVTSTTYRAIVKSEICAEVASASTAIGIVPLSVGGTVSGGGNFCSSASGTLILSGQTGSVVRWEQNVNNAGWTNINSTDALLHYYSVTKTTQYRAWVVSGLCAGQYSSIATVSVSPASVGGTVVGGGNFCGSASGTLTLSGHTGSVVRWEQNVANAGWTSIGNTTTSLNYSGVVTSTTYRAVVKSETCEEVTTASTAIDIKPAPVGGTVALTEEIYQGMNGAITLSGHNSTLLNWEINTGSGWVPVASTSATLRFGNPSYTSAQYRAVVQRGPLCTIAYSGIMKVERAFVANSGSTTLTAQTGATYQWYKDGAILNGATLQTYTTTDPGIYKVSVAGVFNSVFYLYNLLENQTAVNATSTTSVLVEGATDVFGLASNQIAQSVAYADGLGRVFQSVAVKGSPAQTDMITPVGLGRQGFADTTYLPYTSIGNDGRYRPQALKGSSDQYITSEQYLFYQGTAKVAQDASPFARAIYRNTPDGKVVKQSAPGADWQLSTNKVTTSEGTFNDATTYRVRYWKPDGTTNSNWATNTVVVTIGTDENSNQVRTYTNLLGQTVLKQVQIDDTLEGVVTAWLETYYIYDGFGRLKYQVPPKAMKVLGTGATLDAKAASVAELIYTYTYDAKGRLVEKKVPGAAVEQIVYDNYDRPVMTQDGNQRAQNRWMFVKHDRYNRVVYSGFYARTVTRSVLQGEMDALNYNTQPYFETEAVNATTFGYTTTVYPTANLTILAVNYYDHYDFDRNGTADYTYINNHFAGQETTASASTRGMATGGRIRVIDAAGAATATWLISTVFYDKYDRPIQTRSNNTLYATVADVQTTVYDFVKPLRTKTTHNQNATTSVVLEDRSEYDHAGRVLKKFRKINTNPEQLLAQYEYNALGQLVDKKLHDVGGGNFLQSVDYRYNIRGWLRSVNGSQLTVTGDNDDTNDYFGMELLYNTTESGLANTQYYNGNISAVKWKGLGTTGAIDQRSYKYVYDKSDRMKTATFQAHDGSTWAREANTLNENVTYDHNGNIKTLQRSQNSRSLSVVNGLPVVNNTALTVDNLTYTYASNLNRLTRVEDAVANTVGVGDFKNVNSANSAEYAYASDGSLTRDDNKGIMVGTSGNGITYNVLGKPRQITFNNNRRVDYFYDAAGNKTKVQVWTGSPLVLTSTTDYVGGFVYENNNLSFFSSPEGRVVKNGANFEYQYAIADHQGNTRVLFTSAPQTPQPVTANFEAATNANFQNYVNRSGFSLFNRTAGGTTSQLLNGGVNGRVGLAKSYRLFAGDKVKVEAYAKYQNLIGTTSTLSSFASALLTAFALPTPAGGEVGTPSAGVSSWGNAVAGGNGQSENATAPKIFVNLLVLDKNNRVLDIAYKQVTTVAAQNGATPVVPHEYLMREYTAKEECFVYVYLSNEHPTLVDAYFDDVTVTYTPSNVVQYNEYYPFQSTTQNSWTRVNAVKNNFLGNGGTELNTTSNFYDLEYRAYDPILGRMNGVDPMSDKYSSLSPYNYSFNMPNMVVDVNGADPYTINYSATTSPYYTMYTYDDRIDPTGLGATTICGQCWREGNAGAMAFYGAAAGYGQGLSGFGGGGGWTANIGGLIINYNSLKDGVHSFNFSNGQLTNYTGYDFQTVSSKYGTSYHLTDQYGNSNNDLVYSFGYSGKDKDRKEQVVVIGGGDLKFEGLSRESKAIADATNATAYNVTFLNVVFLASGIAEDIKDKYLDGQKVKIYGYSKGGDLALQVSRKLNDASIPISLLLTIDVADGPFSPFINRSVPPNVWINYNFFQTTPSSISSRGDYNTGSGLIFNYNVTNPSINHGNIDEAAIRISIFLLKH